MLCKVILAVCSEIHTKHIRTLDTVSVFRTGLKLWRNSDHLCKQFQYVDVTNEILPPVDV
jgi:hypothetical protein